MNDTFRGDNAQMIRSIEALLSLDAAGALVPHGIGGHARELLESAAVRLAAAAAPVECRASQLPSGWVCDGKACDRCTRNAPTTPPAVMPAAPSDAEILALNDGERLFSESPSKYGLGTQYHTGEPGLLQFAREVLALSQTMQPQAEPAAGEQAARNWIHVEAIDYLEVPDVQDESGINVHYSRDLVLQCIDAAIEAGKEQTGAVANTALAQPFNRLDHEALTAIPFDSDWSDTRERRAYGKRVAESAAQSCDIQLQQRLATLAAPGTAIAAREQPGLTRDAIQKKAIEHGFEYWRASDAHGVTGTKPQAIELLQDLIGVEVEIEDNGCSTCDGTGVIGGPSYYSPDEGGVPCPDCASREPFQQRVQPWLVACFGEMIAGDREERNHRFIEEALELVQACGCTRSEAHQLADYVFSRPVGEKSQEVGGVMVTLAALCLAQDLDMAAAGETELARIWTKVEQIRAKQAAKPKYSPLPTAPEPEDTPLETGEGDAR